MMWLFNLVGHQPIEYKNLSVKEAVHRMLELSKEKKQDIELYAIHKHSLIMVSHSEIDGV